MSASAGELEMGFDKVSDNHTASWPDDSSLRDDLLNTSNFPNRYTLYFVCLG